jgi:hypothetical protein
MTLHTIYNRNELSAFEALVTKDVKSQISDSEMDTLVLNIDKWLYCLYVMKRDVEYYLSSRVSTRKISTQQMKDRSAPQEELTTFLASESLWKVNTLKFLNSLEKKILFVKFLSKELSNSKTLEA